MRNIFNHEKLRLKDRRRDETTKTLKFLFQRKNEPRHSQQLTFCTNERHIFFTTHIKF